MLGSLLQRAFPSLTVNDYISQVEEFAFNGIQYVVPGGGVAELTALQGQRNPIVGTCVSIRAATFSEVRFAWQPFEATRTGRLFGTDALSVLERPWDGGNTGTLLTRMEVDLSLYGNSYWVRQGNELVRLDPGRVTVVSGEVEVGGVTVGTRLLGYTVTDHDNRRTVAFMPNEVAHYKTKVDAKDSFVGVSWLHEVLPDVQVDYQFTEFKKSFVREGAVPGLAVTYPPGTSKEQIEAVADAIRSKHSGSRRSFRTLHLGGGADPKVIGANLEQLNTKAIQGAGETRIAAAAGVAPVIASFSEGLQGSQLNAGNYVAARRRFADMTIRPLWRAACASLETLVPPPDGLTRLWYEDRDVAFLQEDVKDAAEIKWRDAASVRQLLDAGYTADSAVEAVMTGDFTKLEHSGLFSVQLQRPMTEQPPNDLTD